MTRNGWLFPLVIAVLSGVAACSPRSEDKAADAKPVAVADTAGLKAGAVDAPGPGDLLFELATEKLPAEQTQLINGQKVELQTRDWPAVVITPLEGPPAPNGERQFGKCTGTLVGPGVILFAAHCLDERPAAMRPAFLKVDANLTIRLTCAMHPDYTKPPSQPAPSPRRSEDWALCYADTEAELPALMSMRFEQIDLAPAPANTKVLMMGYGCTDLATREQDNTLRIGDAKITNAAGAPGAEVAYARIISHGPPEPALCPGDSGGPLMTGATTAQQTLPRRVRGVNSSIQRVPQGLASRVSMLSDRRFASWATTWVNQFPRAYICGLPSDYTGQRSCRI